MTRDDACTAVLNRLQLTWPSAWRALDTADPQHPLYEEILALRSSGTCHLPFFGDRGQASWISIAGDADALRSAIAGLRAWIIPSFAWEDRARPVLRPNDYSGPLAGALAELAPAGYYRWHSGPAGTAVIPPRLRLWRQVQSRRPSFASAKPPGLFELREQFRLALATGDPAIAYEVLNAIDERQLDTAANTLFMRTQARARFGAYAEITHEPKLAELVSLRLPQAVRSNIVHAFFEVYLRAHDERGDTESAARAFKEAVYPAIGGLLALCRPEDGKPVERTLVYYAATTGATQSSVDNPEQEFFDALRQGDWRAVQESGARLLDAPDATTSALILRAALTESLKHRPNAHLETRLAPEHKASPVPENWSQFIARLRAAEYESAESFLELDERPPLHPGRIADTRETVAGIEELFTDPNRDDNPAGIELLGRSLPLLIEDIVGETDFPRYPLGAAYLSLLQLWTQERATHLQPADTSVAVYLAGGTLQCVPDADTQVANILRQWWESRQVRARLPFLLEALDLLAQYARQFGIAQGLWIEGVSFVRAQAVELTRAERQLWRSLGRRLGFDNDTLAEYLPEPAVATEQDSDDVLSVAGLHKIAIISLHEKAAQAAAILLRERTQADVFVVAELAAGPGTKNARTADVVLLVWAATKHAVYRAFDDMRDKIAYVQGTGAGSIVLALERWVASSRATVV